MSEVAAREVFLMRKGADGPACEGDMRKFGSEGIIPIPYAGNGFERVDVSGNITVGDIQMNAGPRAKLLD